MKCLSSFSLRPPVSSNTSRADILAMSSTVCVSNAYLAPNFPFPPTASVADAGAGGLDDRLRRAAEGPAAAVGEARRRGALAARARCRRRSVEAMAVGVQENVGFTKAAMSNWLEGNRRGSAGFNRAFSRIRLKRKRVDRGLLACAHRRVQLRPHTT